MGVLEFILQSMTYSTDFFSWFPFYKIITRENYYEEDDISEEDEDNTSEEDEDNTSEGDEDDTSEGDEDILEIFGELLKDEIERNIENGLEPDKHTEWIRDIMYKYGAKKVGDVLILT